MIDDNSEHRKAKGVNKNYCCNNKSRWIQRCFDNKQCLANAINRVQNKDHRIGTYEINFQSGFCLGLIIKYIPRTMKTMD